MDEKEKNIDQIDKSSDEIDLIALAKTLWNGRRTVIITVIIFAILGLFVALFSPKEYTASTTMVPQINSASSKMGGLSSLASLAGFNLDMNAGGNELSPIIYPKIVSSTEFQLKIINTKYSFEELDEEVTLFDYYMDYSKPGLFGIIKKYTLGLPGVVISAIKGDKVDEISSLNSDTNMIQITPEQDGVIKILNENLALDVNEKDGYLTLESHFHQASLAAQVAEEAKLLLQEKITQYKIEKANAQLLFLNERYLEKKKEFEEAQEKLAIYRDANKNISSAVKKTQEVRLENEFQLAFEVYSELAKQLEQARIKVKEDTPVFSIIEPVVVPLERSKPKRTIILFIFVFLGGVVGAGMVFGKHFLRDIRKKWNESQ